MALSSFDDWKDLQEGLLDAMRGTGPKPTFSKGALGSNEPKVEPEKKDLMKVLMTQMSGLDRSLVQKSAPLMQDLMSRNDPRLNAKFVAKLMGLLGVDLPQISAAKNLIAKTEGLMQKQMGTFGPK